MTGYYIENKREKSLVRENNVNVESLSHCIMYESLMPKPSEIVSRPWIMDHSG